MHERISMLAALVLCLACGASLAAEVKTLDVGARAPDFSLPGVDGKNWALKDFADAKILVVIFTCNHCPTAQAYEQRIIRLDKDFHDKGVALVAINPNSPEAVRLDELGYTDISDSLEEMKIRARERGFPFPYLYDGQTQKTAHAYGVQATPHVFIFDKDRKLRYVGRIDDSEVKTVHHQDARDAIEALLAGKPVPVEKTRVFGCSTKWIDKEDGARKAIEKWNQEPVELKEIDAAGVKDLVTMEAAVSPKSVQDDSTKSRPDEGKKLRLINLWATWCGPCVAEMPEFVTMQRMYRQRGFELVTISLDDMKKKDKALEFLKDRHVAAMNYIYNSDDKDALAAALDKEWPGPVPHTILVTPSGKIIYRHTGQIDPLEVKRAIVEYLGRTY